MKYIKYMLFIIAFLNTGIVQPMQRLESNQEKIDKCVANLPKKPASAEFLKTVSFDENNNFQIGEIVLTPNVSGRSYWFSCVTSLGYDLSFNPPLPRIGVKRNFPSPGYSASFGPRSVGKLTVEQQAKPLVELTISNIIGLLKSGKMHINDIKPPKLTEDLFDKVIETMIEELRKK